MDALEFIKAIKQMLSAGANNSTVQKYISAYKKNDCEGMVKAAEQWAAEHPVKTRQSEFLTMFPGADVGKTDGCLTLNPCHFYKKMQLECSGRKCSDCRKAFWLAEVEDV